MPRSKILLVGLALVPAVILVAGHSSIGEAKGDECRAKPDSSAPAGLHWYYRVDRANNRHCWYLHEQGMRVHSLVHATTPNPDTRDDVATENDTAGEQAWKAPPLTGSPPPQYVQSESPAEQPNVNFAARWVDLPKSVDLNAHESVAASNGYAAEPGVESRREQLPPAWANVPTVNGDVRPNAGAETNFGSISLIGSVVLALLLMSEACVRLVRSSGWNFLRRHLRVDPRHRAGDYRARHCESTVEAGRNGIVSRSAMRTEPIPREHAGVSELRRLLQRAGTGLRPPQSFAPSRSMHRREHANRARAHSAFARLKSRSFSGMTWAPL
jgi:hypothetical protein